MELTEIIGVALLVAVVLAIVAIAVRRSMLVRSGGVDVCWRTALTPDGRGWILGQARYSHGEFLLYRALSPLPGASLRLDRGRLRLGEARAPAPAEKDLLGDAVVILRCSGDGRPLELAMNPVSITGLRSWVESAPPGSRSAAGPLNNGNQA